MDYKKTHNLVVSAFAPTYCGNCKLSGGALLREPCKAQLEKK